MLNTYSIAERLILYRITVLKERAMFRTVCPFCHVPLSLQELEAVELGEHAGLACPECAGVLVTEGQDTPRLDELRESHAVP